MHTSKVTNFPHASSGTPFTSVTIACHGSSEGIGHINTSMSSRTQEVTLFFGSLEEVSQFASDLLNHVIEQTCTSTDPTEHQGNTCPVHVAATAISEGVTG